MLMAIFLVVIIVILVLFWAPILDNFRVIEVDPLSQYKQLLIPTTTKKQRYLSFLDNLNVRFKSNLPKTGPYRGTCDDKLNQTLQNKSLNDVFNSEIKNNDLEESFRKDPCVAVSNYLCEFTDPNMYLSESQMPPRWIMKSLKDQPLPSHVDIHCFNRIYNCCRQII
jgi:hypothetical protein